MTSIVAVVDGVAVVIVHGGVKGIVFGAHMGAIRVLMIDAGRPERGRVLSMMMVVVMVVVAAAATADEVAVL